MITHFAPDPVLDRRNGGAPVHGLYEDEHVHKLACRSGWSDSFAAAEPTALGGSFFAAVRKSAGSRQRRRGRYDKAVGTALAKKKIPFTISEMDRLLEAG